MQDAIDKTVLNTLRESLGDDDEFLAELIETFMQDSPEQLAAARAGVAGGDAEAVRRAAHSLKSNSASFGAMSLADLCGRLEEHGKQGDLSAAKALLPEVEAAYASAAQALRELR